MEIPSPEQQGIFSEEPRPELFAGFATAGRWLRFLGSLGVVASAVWLFMGLFSGNKGIIVPGVIGGSVCGYVSLQLVLFGIKSVAAQQSSNMTALSDSGRHLRNAFKVLGLAGLILLLLAVAMFCYLFLFGGFDRGSPY